MKPDIDTYILYFEKFFRTLKEMLTSAMGLPVILFSGYLALGDAQKGLVILAIALFCDLITGCLASWLIHRKNKNAIQVYFIETGKIRLSGVKLATYFFLILMSWMLTDIFFNKKIALFMSNKEFSFVELIIICCIAVEIYSNIENAKRAGFDILGRIVSVAKGGWKVFRTVKSGRDE